jgi:hypothetical protein
MPAEVFVVDLIKQAASMVAWERVRVKAPIGQKHWSVRSGRQLHRREAG